MRQIRISLTEREWTDCQDICAKTGVKSIKELLTSKLPQVFHETERLKNLIILYQRKAEESNHVIRKQAEILVAAFPHDQ